MSSSSSSFLHQFKAMTPRPMTKLERLKTSQDHSGRFSDFMMRIAEEDRRKSPTSNKNKNKEEVAHQKATPQQQDNGQKDDKEMKKQDQEVEVAGGAGGAAKAEAVALKEDMLRIQGSQGDGSTQRLLTMKEMLVRLYYTEMLGTDCDFGLFLPSHLLTATARSPDLPPGKRLLFKRTGYLAVSLCANPARDPELMLPPIVRSIRWDLKSDDPLQQCAGLIAAAKLLPASSSSEMMEVVNREVVGLLKYSFPSMVRRHAVRCMVAFHKKSKGRIGDWQKFREVLTDRDPGVMGVALHAFYESALHPSAVGGKEEAIQESLLDCLPSFVSLLQQIYERRLPKDFYSSDRTVPAPWHQMKLLQIIRLFVSTTGDSGAAWSLQTDAASVVLGALRLAKEDGSRIGHAVMFEALHTLTRIPVSPEVLEELSEVAGEFLHADEANLQYSAVNALFRISQVAPESVIPRHQITVTELMESDYCDTEVKERACALLPTILSGKISEDHPIWATIECGDVEQVQEILTPKEVFCDVAPLTGEEGEETKSEPPARPERVSLHSRRSARHSLLYHAALCGQTSVVELLIANGVPVGAAPLEAAAQLDHTRVVHVLLANRPRSSSREFWGRNQSLHLALQAGHTEMAMLLHVHGASTKQPNAEGKTPLEVAQTEEVRGAMQEFVDLLADISLESLYEIYPQFLLPVPIRGPTVDEMATRGGSGSGGGRREDDTPTDELVSDRQPASTTSPPNQEKEEGEDAKGATHISEVKTQGGGEGDGVSEEAAEEGEGDSHEQQQEHLKEEEEEEEDKGVTHTSEAKTPGGGEVDGVSEEAAAEEGEGEGESHEQQQEHLKEEEEEEEEEEDRGEDVGPTHTSVAAAAALGGSNDEGSAPSLSVQPVADPSASPWPPWLQHLPVPDAIRALFVSEDVDEEAFCQLKEEDLKELGLSMGHRKLLMKEIANRKESKEKA